MLYSTLEFELHHDAALEFLTTVPLRNLNYIQILDFLAVVKQSNYKPKPLRIVSERLHRYEKRVMECCEVLRNLKGLRELRIRLFRNSKYDLDEMRVLKPLQGFQPREKFVVELPWVNGWNEMGGLVKNGRVSGLRGFKCDIVRRKGIRDNNADTRYPRKRIFVHYGPEGILLIACLGFCCFPICLPFIVCDLVVDYLKEESKYRARKGRMRREIKALN